MKRPFYTRLKSVQIIVLTFAVIIAAGAFLLALLFAASDNNHISILDALFVSTSALCVTGLSPIDISTRLSFFGHCFVMILMQVGALGLISFTTLFSYFSVSDWALLTAPRYRKHFCRTLRPTFAA